MGRMTGCAYGMVNRQMISDIKEDISSIKSDIKSGFARLETGQTELFNHQSSRLPLWVTVVFTTLSGLVVGLGVYFLSGR
jgi:hypothetical protein